MRWWKKKYIAVSSHFWLTKLCSHCCFLWGDRLLEIQQKGQAATQLHLSVKENKPAMCGFALCLLGFRWGLKEKKEKMYLSFAICTLKKDIRLLSVFCSQLFEHILWRGVKIKLRELYLIWVFYKVNCEQGDFKTESGQKLDLGRYSSVTTADEEVQCFHVVMGYKSLCSSWVRSIGWLVCSWVDKKLRDWLHGHESLHFV